MSNNEVIDFQEAMEILKVKKSTMYKLVASVDGPKFVKVGKKRLITRSSLLEWIKNHEGVSCFY